MKIAVLCECSRRVASAFEKRGHYAVSCDLKPAEAEGNHIQGDCRDYDWSWADLIIFHPDCTYICNSGVRWLYTEPGRFCKMIKATEFFRWGMSLRNKMIVTENPIPHHYALVLIGRRYDQIIQPYYFGEPESKATCLWLKNLPPLMFKFSGGEGIKQSVHLEPPGKNRSANRARTYQSIAEAMAEQWGIL